MRYIQHFPIPFALRTKLNLKLKNQEPPRFFTPILQAFSMRSSLILILLDIRSLHNVGAIFRTADAMGVKKIYLAGYTPGPYDLFGKLRKDFAKTALGAEKFVPWEKTKNAGALIKKLKSEKVFIASLEQSKNSVPLSNQIAKSWIALVLGNEVHGIPKNILRKSDAVLEIPMFGKKESLNVSVAAGIALYALSQIKKSQFLKDRARATGAVTRNFSAEKYPCLINCDGFLICLFNFLSGKALDDEVGDRDEENYREYRQVPLKKRFYSCPCVSVYAEN